MNKSLLFIELGSVSFKASLVPKDATNRIVSIEGIPHRKLSNLICLDVYREGARADSIAARAESWLKEVHGWATLNAEHPADEVCVVATAAFRDMAFLHEIDVSVRRIFGAAIQVLDGFVEAQLLLNAHGPHRADGPSTTLFDLGGGSLEIVCIGPGPTYFASLPLGAGRVTAWLMDGHPLSEVREWVTREFRRIRPTIKKVASCVWLGTGGTVRSLKKVFVADARGPIRGHDVAREAGRLAAHLFDADGGCLSQAAMEREFQGLVESAPDILSEHRRRIYAGGVILLDLLCRFFGVRAVKPEAACVRTGALRMIQILRPVILGQVAVQVSVPGAAPSPAPIPVHAPVHAPVQVPAQVPLQV